MRRSKRRLEKMHVWVHRRFHTALDRGISGGKYARFWFEVRCKIWVLLKEEVPE